MRAMSNLEPPEVGARLDYLFDRLPRSGDIFFFGCRPESLRPNFYVMNGDKFPSDSDEGAELLALDADFRSDWGIAESGGEVNLPDFFDADGYPYFPRPVDGTSRLPGSVQGDAIREIEGSPVTAGIRGYPYTMTGPFELQSSEAAYAWQVTASAQHRAGEWKFKASLAVPTALENRPKNIGVIAAMYLNVVKY
jgi:hypothetical protein